jgi:hypothetical protein
VEETRRSLPTVCATPTRIVLEVATRHRDVIVAAAEGWGAELELERAYGDTVIGILSVDGRHAPDPGADVDPGDEGD